MPEKKKTLRDVLGNRKFKVWLTPDMAEEVMHLVMSQERKFMKDKELYYEFMKFICLLDLGVHGSTTWCKVGTEECGLLKSLACFREMFKDLLAKDPDYTIDDFIYKEIK
jgi:hypothetical protein